MEIFRKGIVSPEFWANLPKLCLNCAFLQNFYTKKLGEITVFWAVDLLYRYLKETTDRVKPNQIINTHYTFVPSTHWFFKFRKTLQFTSYLVILSFIEKINLNECNFQLSLVFLLQNSPSSSERIPYVNKNKFW